MNINFYGDEPVDYDASPAGEPFNGLIFFGLLALSAVISLSAIYGAYQLASVYFNF